MPELIDKAFATDALTEALREGTGASGQVPARSHPEAPTSRSGIEQNGSKAPLHGTKPPTYEVVKETPEHLVIAYMAASGMSQSECATRTGKHRVTMSNLFRQPWFQQRVVDIISEQGSDVVKTLIAGAAVDSVLRLIHLRDHAESEAVQASTSIHLLDRHLGKAPQKVDHRDERSSDPRQEEARLRRQLAELNRQEQELAQ
jgi:hypothetical protein